MRRVLLALVTTAAGLALLLTYKTPPSTPTAVGGPLPQPRPAPGGLGQGQNGQAQGGQIQGDGSDQGGQSGQGGSRQVTGSVAQTQFGPVQVQLRISGDGRIERAVAVRYPDSGRSREISAQALPQLDRAVVDTQSAEIDAVSGATFTSGGYKESLQAALDQARG
jgi:FMN-binding domain